MPTLLDIAYEQVDKFEVFFELVIRHLAPVCHFEIPHSVCCLARCFLAGYFMRLPRLNCSCSTVLILQMFACFGDIPQHCLLIDITLRGVALFNSTGFIACHKTFSGPVMTLSASLNGVGGGTTSFIRCVPLPPADPLLNLDRFCAGECRAFALLPPTKSLPAMT